MSFSGQARVGSADGVSGPVSAFVSTPVDGLCLFLLCDMGRLLSSQARKRKLRFFRTLLGSASGTHQDTIGSALDPRCVYFGTRSNCVEFRPQNLQATGIAVQNPSRHTALCLLQVRCVLFRVPVPFSETPIKAHSHARSRCSGELAV